MPYNFKKYVRGTIERVIKKFDKAKATDNEYYLFRKLNNLSTGGSGVGGDNIYQFRESSSIISAPCITPATLSASVVSGTRTQVMPIYVPVDCTVDSFKTTTTTSGTLCLVSFGIYTYTNPILSGQEFELVGGATDYDCSAAADHTVTPDSTITLTKGWYMLAMFRNTAAAGQSWLQFANSSQLPIFNWTTFVSGSVIANFYVSNTDLAAGTLPATINEDTDLDYTGASNKLAYGIRVSINP